MDKGTILNLPPVENVKGTPFITVVGNNLVDNDTTTVQCAEGDLMPMFGNSFTMQQYSAVIQLRPAFKKLWLTIISWD